MTDRSRRRTAASDSAEGAPREDNPFAAPPEGTPDQPWQPRRPADDRGGETGGDGPRAAGGPNSPDGAGSWDAGGSQGPGQGSGGDAGAGSAGSGSGSGSTGSSGSADSGSGYGSGRSSGDEGPAWGSRWSSRQPGRGSGGFGRPAPGQDQGQDQGDGDRQDGGGLGGPGAGGGRGLRWDPTDPLQRHARYALHAGVWALFFGLFSVPEVALLLSALSLYWGCHSLRGGSRKESGKDRGRGGRRGARATAEDIAGTDRTTEGVDTTPAPAASSSTTIPVTATPEQTARSQRNAAIGGLVLAALAIAVVASTFAFQMVYEDYFACTRDALTQPSREECRQLLPPELRPFLQGR
jgi:hypothetical protein